MEYDSNQSYKAQQDYDDYKAVRRFLEAGGKFNLIPSKPFTVRFSTKLEPASPGEIPYWIALLYIGIIGLYEKSIEERIGPVLNFFIQLRAELDPDNERE